MGNSWRRLSFLGFSKSWGAYVQLKDHIKCPRTILHKRKDDPYPNMWNCQAHPLVSTWSVDSTCTALDLGLSRILGERSSVRVAGQELHLELWMWHSIPGKQYQSKKYYYSDLKSNETCLASLLPLSSLWFLEFGMWVCVLYTSHQHILETHS